MEGRERSRGSPPLPSHPPSPHLIFVTLSFQMAQESQRPIPTFEFVTEWREVEPLQYSELLANDIRAVGDVQYDVCVTMRVRLVNRSASPRLPAPTVADMIIFKDKAFLPAREGATIDVPPGGEGVIVDFVTTLSSRLRISLSSGVSASMGEGKVGWSFMPSPTGLNHTYRAGWALLTDTGPVSCGLDFGWAQLNSPQRTGTDSANWTPPHPAMESALKYVHGGIGKVLPFLTDTDCGNLYFVCRTARALVSTFHRRVPPWSCAQSLAAYDLSPYRPYDEIWPIVKTGHMGAIRRLTKEWNRKFTRHALDSAVHCAVRFGLMEVLTFLHQELDAHIGLFALATLAIRHEQLDILRYLVEHGCDWDCWWVTKAAIESGRLDMVRYLRQLGCKFEEPSVSVAAELGHLEILRYLFGIGISEEPDTAQRAAQKGQLHIVRYLHEAGSKEISSYVTVAAAVRNGHLDVVRYLCEEAGCELSSFLRRAASERGHREIARYINEWFERRELRERMRYERLCYEGDAWNRG